MEVIINAIRPYSKGVAAAISGAIIMFLAKHNIIIADDLSDAIEIIIGAIIAGVIVFISPKNAEPKQ